MSQAAFEANIQALADFERKTNRLPTATETHRGLRIGSWLAEQRADYRMSRSHPRRQELEQVSAQIWNHRRDTYERFYKATRAYALEHGELPGKNKAHNGKKIGIWVTTMRYEKKKGRLAQAHIDRLEQLPHWTWKGKNRHDFDTLEPLKAFIAEHGRLPHNTETHNGAGLGNWCMRMRARQRSRTLSAKLEANLSKIPGWIWHGQCRNFQQVFERIAAGGKAPPKWILNRRRDHRDGSMKPEHERALNSLPDWNWNLSTMKFPRYIKFLSDFVGVHNELPKPQQKWRSHPLGNWLAEQRRLQARGELHAGRQKRLEKFGW